MGTRKQRRPAPVGATSEGASKKAKTEATRLDAPGKARRRAAVWLAGAGAVAVVALYLRAVLPYELNPYDEGVIAYGAEQVLRGRRPGVDFYVPYSPGAFYAVAAAYRLFGVRLLVERGVGAALILAVVALGFALLARRDETPARPGSLLVAAAAAGMAGILLSVGWFSPVTGGALALLLLSGLAVIAAAPEGTPRAAFLAGLTLGLLMLWRLDFGLGGLAAAAVTWLVARFARGTGRGLSGLLALPLGAALVAGPPFAALLLAGGERAMNSLLLWPLLGTQAAALPWPPLLPGPMPEGPAGTATLDRLAHATGGWPFYFPLLALLLAGLRLTRRGTLTPREITVGTWLLAASVPMFLYANGRTDYAHVLPLLTLSLLLAALAVMGLHERRATNDEQQTTRQEPHWPRVVARWSFVFGLLLFTFSPLARLARLPPTEALPLMELPGERGAGVYPDLPFGMQYGRIVRALHQIAPPGSRIFSGTPRHDLFLTNDVMLYFLSERDPATYYWCLDASVTTTAPVQEEMIRDLERSDPRAAVLWRIAQNVEGNVGARSTGVTVLDDYLQSRFRAVPYQPADASVQFYTLMVPQ